MSVEAARNALARAQIDPTQIRAVWVGSESHPYAVKPTSTIVAEAIGAAPFTQAADLEFACKAGSEAIVMGIGIVGSDMGRYVLAIGMDTAQGRPGDALEYTAASGGAAFIVGPAEESVAVYEATPLARHRHAGLLAAGLRPLSQPRPPLHRRAGLFRARRERGQGADGRSLASQPSDYKYAVLHQPNTKFPQRAAQILGFTAEQIKTGLLVPVIGNTYAGSSLIGLTAILDEAQPGDRIFMVSFGSGAGSDAFSIRVTDRIVEVRGRAPSTQDYIARRKVIDYATYVRFRHKLQMN